MIEIKINPHCAWGKNDEVKKYIEALHFRQNKYSVDIDRSFKQIAEDVNDDGYAKVDNPTKHAWTKLLNHYLEERSSLRGIFLIVDIRHPLKNFDQAMLEYCGANNLALHIILNKSDKLSINNANKVMAEIKEEIREINASIQIFSALKGIGVEMARHKLAKWLFD